MTAHIRIPDVSPVAQVVADGAKTVFSFPFPIFTADDLDVRTNSTLLTSGYTVVGEGSSTGGAVIFADAPANGVRVTLRRRQTYGRTDDFLDERAPTPHELNDAVDQTVAAIQELAEEVSRAVKRPLSSDLSLAVDLSLPAPEAGKVIGWNETAGGLVNIGQPSTTDALLKSQNLADLPDKAVARSNLGLASVAASGSYADLAGKPILAAVALSGQYADLAGKPALGSAAGHAETDFAAGDHTHAGLYEPADSSILRTPAIGVTVQGYDPNTVKKNVANTYSAPQTPGVQVLTDAATVDIAITGQVWTLNTAASRTIGAPTGGVANTFYFLEVVTNGFTPSWNSAFDFGAAGIPTSLTGTCGFDIFYDGSKYRISTRFSGGV